MTLIPIKRLEELGEEESKRRILESFEEMTKEEIADLIFDLVTIIAKLEAESKTPKWLKKLVTL